MDQSHDDTTWTDEMRVRFDTDELSQFFDGFSPLELPDLDNLEALADPGAGAGAAFG